MITNMGKIDRGLRIVIALLLVYLTLVTGALSGVLFWVALVIAVIFTLTSVVGSCPLYRIIGLKTCQDC